MKRFNKVRPLLYGGAIIILANLMIQDDWGLTLFSAIAFVIGGLILPRIITFMSDNKKDSDYK